MADWGDWLAQRYNYLRRQAPGMRGWGQTIAEVPSAAATGLRQSGLGSAYRYWMGKPITDEEVLTQRYNPDALYEQGRITHDQWLDAKAQQAIDAGLMIASGGIKAGPRPALQGGVTTASSAARYATGGRPLLQGEISLGKTSVLPSPQPAYNLGTTRVLEPVEGQTPIAAWEGGTSRFGPDPYHSFGAYTGTTPPPRGAFGGPFRQSAAGPAGRLPVEAPLTSRGSQLTPEDYMQATTPEEMMAANEGNRFAQVGKGIRAEIVGKTAPDISVSSGPVAPAKMTFREFAGRAGLTAAGSTALIAWKRNVQANIADAVSKGQINPQQAQQMLDELETVQPKGNVPLNVAPDNAPYEGIDPRRMERGMPPESPVETKKPPTWNIPQKKVEAKAAGGPLVTQVARTGDNVFVKVMDEATGREQAMSAEAFKVKYGIDWNKARVVGSRGNVSPEWNQFGVAARSLPTTGPQAAPAVTYKPSWADETKATREMMAQGLQGQQLTEAKKFWRWAIDPSNAEYIPEVFRPKTGAAAAALLGPGETFEDAKARILGVYQKKAETEAERTSEENRRVAENKRQESVAQKTAQEREATRKKERAEEIAREEKRTAAQEAAEQKRFAETQGRLKEQFAETQAARKEAAEGRQAEGDRYRKTEEQRQAETIQGELKVRYLGPRLKLLEDYQPQPGDETEYQRQIQEHEALTTILANLERAASEGRQKDVVALSQAFDRRFPYLRKQRPTWGTQYARNAPSWSLRGD